MIINYILSEENYSNGFHLDHVKMFIEDALEACTKHDPASIKTDIVDYHGTDILVIYTDKLNKKELIEKIKADNEG